MYLTLYLSLYLTLYLCICLFVFAFSSLSTSGWWAGFWPIFSLRLIKADDDDDDFLSTSGGDVQRGALFWNSFFFGTPCMYIIKVNQELVCEWLSSGLSSTSWEVCISRLPCYVFCICLFTNILYLSVHKYLYLSVHKYFVFVCSQISEIQINWVGRSTRFVCTNWRGNNRFESYRVVFLTGPP